MRLITRIVALSLLSLPMYTHATSYQGYVKNVFALYGKIFIYFIGGGSRSFCEQESAERFIAWIDPETEYGKAMLSISITAKITKK